MNTVIKSYGPLNSSHKNSILETIRKAQAEYPRLLAIRFDLRFPHEDLRDCLTDYKPDEKVITRFITSMKAQVRADQYRKKKAGKRTHPCRVRYVWVREFEHTGTQQHYHVCLFLNRDMYAGIGMYGGKPDWCNEENTAGLSRMICNAWTRALRLESQKYQKLVYFPENGCYSVITSRSSYQHDHDAMIQRVMYLAKKRSKHTEDGWRNFGCSQY